MDGMQSPPATSQAANPEFEQSAEVDQILPALLEAQKGMINPRKDKEAKVRGESRNGKAYDYTYRYSTLSVINDMIREPLTDNDLLMPLSRPVKSRDGRGIDCFVQIFHKSGQWIGCRWPVVRDTMKMQDFAGGMTFARRYATNALLSIASGEDDDASKASGVAAEISVVREMARGEVFSDAEKTERALHRQLLINARDAKTPKHYENLLMIWQEVMVHYAEFQQDPERRVVFDQAAAAIQSALTRFQPAVGEAWYEIMMTLSSSDVDRVRKQFYLPADDKPAPLSGLKNHHPKLFALLREHMAFFAGRAQQMSAGSTEIDDKIAEVNDKFAKQQVVNHYVARQDGAPPRDPLAEDAAHLGRLTEADLEWDTRTGAPARRATVTSTQSTSIAPTASGFDYHRRDEAGDLASDPILDPARFAEIYAAAWHDAQDPGALATHNAAALKALEQSDEAMYRLDELLNEAPPASPAPSAPARPFPPPLVWPRRVRGGALDVQGALRATAYELEMEVRSEADLALWIAQNKRLWEADDCPATLKSKIELAVMQHRSRLQKEA